MNFNQIISTCCNQYSKDCVNTYNTDQCHFHDFLCFFALFHLIFDLFSFYNKAMHHSRLTSPISFRESLLSRRSSSHLHLPTSHDQVSSLSRAKSPSSELAHVFDDHSHSPMIADILSRGEDVDAASFLQISMNLP